MTRRLRPIALALALTAVLAACGTSSGDGGSDGAKVTTTTAAAASSTTTTAPAETTTTTTARSTTTAADTSTTALTALPSCQALLQEYTDRFQPDDLGNVARFFHEYAPLMPARVRVAVLRIAAAYETAGDLTKLNLADTDLTADAKIFSDWTAAGCPAG